jgi:hypothetical protein
VAVKADAALNETANTWAPKYSALMIMIVTLGRLDSSLDGQGSHNVNVAVKIDTWI